MKIGISAEWIGTQAGGMETYCLNLIRGLTAIDPDSHYKVYTTIRRSNGVLPRRTNLSSHYLGAKSRWIALSLGMPLALLKHPVDLFHATSIIPPYCPSRMVVTVHDLGHVRFPEIYPRAVRFRLSRLIASGARRAEKVIAVSEATKRDLIRYYGLDENKITVIHEGVDEIYRPASQPSSFEPVLKRLNIPPKYILYVGRLHVRKNLVRLIEAFAQIRRTGFKDHMLVLVGRALYDIEPIYKAIESLALKDTVILAGHVHDRDLPHIYAGARLFVYPSFFEGFGLPPLEAMASGIPVIAANASCLPEILGNAAMLFDPYDTDDLSHKMGEILDNSELRRSMKLNGLQHVRRFNWKDTARNTLMVYKEVLNA